MQKSCETKKVLHRPKVEALPCKFSHLKRSNLLSDAKRHRFLNFDYSFPTKSRGILVIVRKQWLTT